MLGEILMEKKYIISLDAGTTSVRTILYDTETLENLTMGTAKIYTALIMLIPAAAALVGAVILIRRKNR